MANYYTQRYNAFLDQADELRNFLTGDHMNELEGRYLDLTGYLQSMRPMKFSRIAEYRRTDSDETILAQVRAGVLSALGGCRSGDCGVGWFLVSDGTAVQVYFASETNAPTMDRCLKQTVPDLRTETGFVAPAVLARCAAYGGVITGAFLAETPIADSLIEAMKGHHCILALLARPVSAAQALAYEEGLHSLQSDAESIAQRADPISGMRISSPALRSLSGVLSALQNRFAGKTHDLWETCIWFGSEDEHSAQRLGSTVSGVLSTCAAADVERCRRYMTVDNPLRNGRIGMSDAVFGAVDYPIAPALRKSSMTSYVTSAELASVMQMPLLSNPAVNVLDLNVGWNAVQSFATNPTLSGEIMLGTESDTCQSYSLRLSDLRRHCLITAEPGGGKTTAVKRILVELARQKIPFCVIESAKRDYWDLISAVPDLKVYSAGMSALPLTLNVLEPEEGVIISDHIDDVMTALSGAFTMETPTRLALRGLISYTYEKMGFDVNGFAYGSRRRWPTVADLQSNLDEYCTTHLHYGREVAADVRGTMDIRLRSLMGGAAANLLTAGRSLTGAQLTEGNVVVELEDLSADVRPFIATMLLMKINRYVRQRNAADTLRNLVVVEEAHNVFSRVQGSPDHPRAVASSYLADMLTQLREFGTGFIISDQGASNIHPAAVQNTKIKLIGLTGSSADLDEVRFALGLSDAQARRLPLLRTGQFVAAVGGNANVCRVNVTPPALPEPENLACLLCRWRSDCQTARLRSALQRMGARKAYYLAQIHANRYDPRSLRAVMNGLLRELGLEETQGLCVLGLLLEEDTAASNLIKRRILYAYERG